MLSNQPAITKQLADWQVLPQPESLSELYFTDHTNLPKILNANVTQPVNFTVHNVEHRPTTYYYKLVATVPDSSVEQQLAEGTFMLDHNATRTTNETITVPGLGPRIGIRVDLFYKTLRPNHAENITTQSINYWTAVKTDSQVAL
ncbi:MAG TPA: hypothetical protein VFT87_00125 [Candidatus Saccharimonadales bacterium]|nr:hypothetical protein [Candidatus Saccharimonadales bacterium]